MTVMQIVFGILLLLAAIVLIIVVLSQHGRQAGLSGTIQGGAETFLDKNKGRSVDAMLRRMTKYIAIVFAALMLLMNVLILVLGW